MLHIAGLGHEPVDHPVKDDAVIGLLIDQSLDPLHMLGGDIGQEFDLNLACIHCDHEGIVGICHTGLRSFGSGGMRPCEGYIKG